MDYTAQFLTICGLHLLAVASPGPDFAIVLKQSVVFGRRTAIWTSLGIGSGILVHITYSLLGIGLLVKSSLLAFTVLKMIASAYLVWIGWKALRAKPRNFDQLQAEGRSLPTLPRASRAWALGFMTNALNPKATLFFVAVFSAVIDPRTPRIVQAGYGVWMAVMTALWFSGVTYFFTQDRVRRSFVRMGHWFDRTMGAVLIALGIRLAFATAGK